MEIDWEDDTVKDEITNKIGDFIDARISYDLTKHEALERIDEAFVRPDMTPEKYGTIYETEMKKIDEAKNAVTRAYAALPTRQ